MSSILIGYRVRNDVSTKRQMSPREKTRRKVTTSKQNNLSLKLLYSSDDITRNIQLATIRIGATWYFQSYSFIAIQDKKK